MQFVPITALHDENSNPWGFLANYPSSPGRKRCEQGVAYSSGICSIEEKSLSSPPGKYGRKTET